VRKVLLGAGVPPAAQRQATTWRQFLRQQAASVWACDLSVEADRVKAWL
jgi:hypothetical protein